MAKAHDIEGVAFERDQLRIRIDGADHVFALKAISSRLLQGSQVERATFEISPSGYGIYWPLLDEDLSIDGLLGIVHKPASRRRRA